MRKYRYAIHFYNSEMTDGIFPKYLIPCCGPDNSISAQTSSNIFSGYTIDVIFTIDLLLG